ncbi:MAG TPA: ACT domain-containing protein [Ruminiclostridium sp.]|nr:ACT domain-containing protein [Ruminiclostridium sp.]
MNTVTNITTLEDTALITLRNSSSDIKFMAGVFKMIAQRGVNVDMISQTAPLGGRISLSFTVSGDDLGKILELLAILRNDYPELKSDISSGNCKISVYGEGMRDLPGVAAETFEILSDLRVEVHLITTSEVDISVLVPKSDFEAAYDGLVKHFNK